MSRRRNFIVKRMRESNKFREKTVSPKKLIKPKRLNKAHIRNIEDIDE